MLYEVGFEYDDFWEGGWVCCYKSLSEEKAQTFLEENRENYRPLQLLLQVFPLDIDLYPD